MVSRCSEVARLLRCAAYDMTSLHRYTHTHLATHTHGHSLFSATHGYRCGAHDITVDDKEDAFLSFSQATTLFARGCNPMFRNAFLRCSQADIDQILEGSTTVRHASTAVGGSVFSKAAYLPCYTCLPC